MFRDRFWLALILTIPVVLYSETIQNLLNFSPPQFTGSEWVGPILGTVIFFYGGIVFLRSAISELKAKQPGMMTLIAIAILSAYLYSLATTFLIEGTEFFWELATLISVMLFGHWMEMRSVSAAGSALEELAKLLPDTAERIVNGKSEIVALAELKVGDIIHLRPGGQVPVDGQVVEGKSDLTEAIITGESKPIVKAVGDKVIAGTINGNGALKIKVAKIGEQTALAGIMRLVAEAQQSKSQTQLIADRAAFYLTFIAILVSAGASIGWIAAGAAGAFVVERAVSVLVIACPHALGLAVPLVVSISTQKSSQNGLLIRDRKAFEQARLIDTVVFDKTGTLTTGSYGVQSIWTNSLKEEEVLALAASVDNQSEHFIARAVVDAAKAKKLKLEEVANFVRLPGKGVSATIAGKRIEVGGLALLKEKPSGELEKFTDREAADGKTVIFIKQQDEVIGAISLADSIRSEAGEAIQDLKAQGINVAMLTGDSKPVATWVAKELGLTEFFAEVLPQDKSKQVTKLQSKGRRVLMVGDGVNDAPALVTADIGMAIGAGTDVAIESAGVILVRDDPRDVVKVIKLSKATYRKMIQNLWWAAGYNVVAIPLAAGVLANQGLILQPWLGALFMSASTVVVAINAQFLRKIKLGGK
ncbi:heavy metal translocating P-type ATPase [Candidatus Berkelbacteria bacterium]|nr:heavy metal translocating P-type ATPase [Candidatus Berkelbacteria bacterium]